VGVEVVFECTGVFTNTEALNKHLQAGAKYVILSAPPKDALCTIVHGVTQPPEGQQVFSCASCTTNCIAPVIEILGRRIGIKKAVMTTIHAYTSTQLIVDGPARHFARGRAGAANFVPTTTGAAKATTVILPQYKGKFDGVAIRGPVPCGSVLGVAEDPLVSSDIIKDPRASVVELSMTQVVDGDLVKVMTWYDNEWGYTNQMIREAVRLVS